MIVQADMKMLERLGKGVLAAPAMSEEDIKRVQRLFDMGLVHDFSSFVGHRTPIRLRIWGINDRGRAVLEQRALTTNSGPQLSLRRE
jgi:hypothetical protein